MRLLDSLSKYVASRRPPPVYKPEPPTQEAYQTAMATVDAMRKERDRWVDEAARSSREVRDLRVSRDAAWARIEEMEREMAYLKFLADQAKEGG